MPGMFKSEGKDGHISILRLDKQVMISTSPAQKTYSEITFAQMEKQITQGRSKAADAMKKRMEGMPPEKRKMMEDQMAKITGHREEVKMETVPTGEHKVIDGYQCTGYVIKRNGKDEETVWATKMFRISHRCEKTFCGSGKCLRRWVWVGTCFILWRRSMDSPLKRMGRAIRRKSEISRQGLSPHRHSMFLRGTQRRNPDWKERSNSQRITSTAGDRRRTVPRARWRVSGNPCERDSG